MLTKEAAPEAVETARSFQKCRAALGFFARLFLPTGVGGSDRDTMPIRPIAFPERAGPTQRHGKTPWRECERAIGLPFRSGSALELVFCRAARAFVV